MAAVLVSLGDRDVLEARARALARPVERGVCGDSLDVLTFALANEIYALESRFVSAVFRLHELSLLPGAAPPVHGVTAWRGELLTVLDLRSVLGLSAAALSDLSRVIALGEDRPAFGILADEVLGVVSCPSSEIRRAPEGQSPERDYLRGVTAEALLILDAAWLLRTYS